MEKWVVMTNSGDIELTQEDIDCIMSDALDYIGYWCSKAEPVGGYLGEYASDQISRGGELLIYDFEDETVYTLNQDKFMQGVKMYAEMSLADDEAFIIENLDGPACDAIIQYALFGDIVYG